MAVQIFSFSPSLSSSLSLSSSVSSSALATTSTYRFLMNPIDRHAFDGVCICAPTVTNKRAGIIAYVSLEVADGGGSQSESDDQVDLAFDKIPADPKLQRKLEHKMKMKLSKKIRLRSKKLQRKRRMRKRGRRPPSR
ncbi:hypothetical protein F2P56_007470 [Juglans regia]|uniref:50S ribosomal protein 5 alpha, chloroplastic-like n=2 Tax=Juglans regia TaxID=51240 RepID=A0A2I4H8V7_JUGRE|nr:50S ribosomal protein 5 alpha, chloroplastic-like [Juglans regia]XP_018852590.1 50S ribosomal protein 5 alpha, chloroplastic-like [Juglans regia]XP_035544052.1 50S ribosomal protein 5 alpha, chloroplastic-like [Juglans regia]XP_035544053.1 50S ribosomal protein 5 alpha, chloroplastic-like [Juglans regia]KAF5475694.1 hypothetical protein F2P56_007470 [Juglans regia]